MSENENFLASANKYLSVSANKYFSARSKIFLTSWPTAPDSAEAKAVKFADDVRNKSINRLLQIEAISGSHLTYKSKSFYPEFIPTEICMYEKNQQILVEIPNIK